MLVRHNIRYMYRPSADHYTILNCIITLPYVYLCTADINECLTNNGSCHGCSNTDGSYDCFCNSGFKVVEYDDGVTKTCIGKGYLKRSNCINSRRLRTMKQCFSLVA